MTDWQRCEPGRELWWVEQPSWAAAMGGAYYTVGPSRSGNKQAVIAYRVEVAGDVGPEPTASLEGALATQKVFYRFSPGHVWKGRSLPLHGVNEVLREEIEAGKAAAVSHAEAFVEVDVAKEELILAQAEAVQERRRQRARFAKEER